MATPPPNLKEITQLFNLKAEALEAGDLAKVDAASRSILIAQTGWTVADHEWFRDFVVNGGTVTIEQD